MKNGLIYVFTGDGKGKTSAALGTVMRAVGNDMRVAWVAWYKQDSWKLSEVGSLKKLGVEVFLMGKGFNIRSLESEFPLSGTGRSRGEIKVATVGKDSLVVDKASEEEHKKAAENALEKAGELIEDVDVLVLDEVNNAVDEGLIDLADLKDLISKRKQTHLVLTGRNVSKKVMELADLVTECKKIKHPYDSRELAVKGLDY